MKFLNNLIKARLYACGRMKNYLHYFHITATDFVVAVFIVEEALKLKSNRRF